MGGKSKQEAPPAPVMPPMQDNTVIIEQMMGMMGAMMQNMPQPPAQLPVPEVHAAPKMDWRERQDQLQAKARADYTNDRSRAKGRQDTVLTSPLLDDEETTTTTKSLISGA